MEDKICLEDVDTLLHCGAALGYVVALEDYSCQIALVEGRICWEGVSTLLGSALGQMGDVLEERSCLLMLVEDMTCLVVENTLLCLHVFLTYNHHSLQVENMNLKDLVEDTTCLVAAYILPECAAQPDVHGNAALEANNHQTMLVEGMTYSVASCTLPGGGVWSHDALFPHMLHSFAFLEVHSHLSELGEDKTCWEVASAPPPCDQLFVQQNSCQLV